MPNIFGVERNVYIPAKFYISPSAFKTALLLTDTRHTPYLANYVSKAFELRSASGINPVPWQIITLLQIYSVFVFFRSKNKRLGVYICVSKTVVLDRRCCGLK